MKMWIRDGLKKETGEREGVNGVDKGRERGEKGENS